MNSTIKNKVYYKELFLIKINGLYEVDFNLLSFIRILRIIFTIRNGSKGTLFLQSKHSKHFIRINIIENNCFIIKTTIDQNLTYTLYSNSIKILLLKLHKHNILFINNH